MSMLRPQESEPGLADDLGIHRDKVIDVSSMNLKLRVLPTVLVVNEFGKIIYAHEFHARDHDTDAVAGSRCYHTRHGQGTPVARASILAG